MSSCAARIRVEPLSTAAHFAASRQWRRYRKQGGPRLRTLTDFLVGAHAGAQNPNPSRRRARRKKAARTVQ